eukprot:749959-Hanusia_phi.AAC.1
MHTGESMLTGRFRACRTRTVRKCLLCKTGETSEPCAPRKPCRHGEQEEQNTVMVAWAKSPHPQGPLDSCSCTLLVKRAWMCSDQAEKHDQHRYCAFNEQGKRGSR